MTRHTNKSSPQKHTWQPFDAWAERPSLEFYREGFHDDPMWRTIVLHRTRFPKVVQNQVEALDKLISAFIAAEVPLQQQYNHKRDTINNRTLKFYSYLHYNLVRSSGMRCSFGLTASDSVDYDFPRLGPFALSSEIDGLIELAHLQIGGVTVHTDILEAIGIYKKAIKSAWTGLKVCQIQLPIIRKHIEVARNKCSRARNKTGLIGTLAQVTDTGDQKLADKVEKKVLRFIPKGDLHPSRMFQWYKHYDQERQQQQKRLDKLQQRESVLQAMLQCLTHICKERLSAELDHPQNAADAGDDIELENAKKDDAWDEIAEGEDDDQQLECIEAADDDDYDDDDDDDDDDDYLYLRSTEKGKNAAAPNTGSQALSE